MCTYRDASIPSQNQITISVVDDKESNGANRKEETASMFSRQTTTVTGM